MREIDGICKGVYLILMNGLDNVRTVTAIIGSVILGGWDVIMRSANSTKLSIIPHYDGYTYHDRKFT